MYERVSLADIVENCRLNDIGIKGLKSLRQNVRSLIAVGWVEERNPTSHDLQPTQLYSRNSDYSGALAIPSCSCDRA
jgi:hypothetical protein